MHSLFRRFDFSTATIFRALVVGSLVVGVFGAAVDHLVPGLRPPALDDAYTAYLAAEEPSLWFIIAFLGVTAVMLIGSVVGTVGLLMFKPWGRGLSLWTSVLSVFYYPFMGAVLSSGWASMSTAISLMLWGAALAMAYGAELQGRFSGGIAPRSPQ